MGEPSFDLSGTIDSVPLSEVLTAAEPRKNERVVMATYISGKRLPWRRYWVPLDGKIRCGTDGRGFLDDPEEPWGRYANPQLRTIDQLLLKRCVILSGHPGIGKTVEIESVRDQAKTQRHPPDEVFFLYCRGIGSAEMLRSETVRHPRWIQARAAQADITLIIDGVDEGLRKVPELISSLTLLLREEPSERLRLALACRSAEWDFSAGESLMGLWPKDERAGIYELGPLRYRDVQEAARGSGVDEAAFLSSVRRHQVESMAARPMTLRLLLDEFAAKGDLPETRKELYARAAERMCREFDEDRLKALGKHYDPVPPQELYRTVSRIAAILMLTGRDAVLKRDDEQASPVEVHWRVVVGGPEVTDAGSFEVTEHHVEATLETAHFSFRGPFRYGFDQSTFSEFLAADYLSNLSLVQLRQLLCRTFKGREWVAPQLAEVAAWLGVSHEDWRGFLIHTQPAILLKADLRKLANEDKKALLASLLEHADREETMDEAGSTMFYHTLRHPGIAGQLRPYIVDTTKNWVVRRMAIEISGAAHVRELEPELWRRIAADDPAYNPLTHALRELAGKHSRQNLLKALHGGFPGDANHDLLGAVIHVLVPSLLPVRAVLPRLVEERDNSYTGSYDVALWFHLPRNLTVADLPALLRHMIRWKRCFDGLSPFHHIAERGFALSLSNIQKPEVARLLVTMWLGKLRTYEPLPVNDEMMKKATSLIDDVRRRDFARAMLNDNRSKAEDLVYPGASLLHAPDLAWLLDELPRSPQKHRAKWAGVTAALLFMTDRTPYRQALLSAYNSVPELRRILPIPRKGDIDVTLSRREKASALCMERRRRKWKRNHPRPSRRELLNHAFEVLRKVNATAWVRISRWVYLSDADATDPADKRLIDHYDITTATGWIELSDAEKAEALDGAERFLLELDDQRSNPTQYTNFAEAGYHAVRLLRERILNAPKLRQAVRRKWVYAVTDHFNNGEEKHQEMVAFMYRIAPRLVTERLLVRLQLDDKKNGFALELRAYGQAWCTRLSAALSGFVLNQRRQLHAQTIKSVLKFLVKYDPRAAVSTTEQLLGKPNSPFRFTPRARAVASVALFSLPKLYWDRVWPKFVRTTVAVQKALFLESTFELDRSQGMAFATMSDTQLGELHLLLLRLFPSAERPEVARGEEHVVTGEDLLRDLRRYCINLLVERATDSSIVELDRQIELAPPEHRSGLRWRRDDAVKGRVRKLWTEAAPKPEEVLLLARSRTARRVEDEESLREAVLSSLERLQAEFDKDGLPSPRELWNEGVPSRGGCPSPKREEELSHLVRRWLNKDLPAKTGIIVNCEVKVERFGHGKLDLKVEAVTKEAAMARRIAVVIEVKRCSHSEVATACESQLVKGYLEEQGLTHGIYLIGWYGSSDGSAKKWHARDEARRCVASWAADASKAGRSASGFLLDCRLPAPTAPSQRARRGLL